MGQKPKPMKETIKRLDGKKNIVIMGCGGCSIIFHTGGPEEVDKMAEELKKYGKQILAKIKLPFGTFCCYLPMSSMFLRQQIFLTYFTTSTKGGIIVSYPTDIM